MIIKSNRKYIKMMVQSKQIPDDIITDVATFSKSTANQIKYNMDNEFFLPLEIKQSLLKNAGLGIFVTQTVEIYSIIVTYLGCLKTNLSVNYKSDSLLQVGNLAPFQDGDPLSCQQSPTNTAMQVVLPIPTLKKRITLTLCWDFLWIKVERVQSFYTCMQQEELKRDKRFIITMEIVTNLKIFYHRHLLFLKIF